MQQRNKQHFSNSFGSSSKETKTLKKENGNELNQFKGISQV